MAGWRLAQARRVEQTPSQGGDAQAPQGTQERAFRRVVEVQRVRDTFEPESL